ncbi:hypothetical protein PC123_g18523 [Phytophthora cactorum]|nr:hypothetical protein PC123_g18523 [Phytophthora cactorum]
MLEFMKSMMAAYLQCGGFGSVREIAFITGNASIHHREIVTEYLQGEHLSSLLASSFFLFTDFPLSTGETSG